MTGVKLVLICGPPQPVKHIKINWQTNDLCGGIQREYCAMVEKYGKNYVSKQDLLMLYPVNWVGCCSFSGSPFWYRYQILYRSSQDFVYPPLCLYLTRDICIDIWRFVNIESQQPQISYAISLTIRCSKYNIFGGEQYDRHKISLASGSLTWYTRRRCTSNKLLFNGFGWPLCSNQKHHSAAEQTFAFL